MTNASRTKMSGGRPRRTRARRHSSLIIVLIAISLIAALVFAAVSAEGREISRATSNDGGAWLINRELSVVGHKNHAAGELSSFIRIPDAPQADVHQAGDLVVVHDPSTRQLIEVDTRAFNADLEPTILPDLAQVHAVENAIVVAQAAPLAVWNIAAVQLATLQDLTAVQPQFSAQGEGTVTVRADGTIAVLEHSSMALTWFAPDGTASAPIATEIDPEAQIVDVTIVDDTTVILLASGDLVLVGSAALESPLSWEDFGAGYQVLARLQQPSGNADPLIESPAKRIAGVTATGELLSIELRDSDATVTMHGGLGGENPLAPIAFGDCIYGVVTSPPRFGKACAEFSSRELQGAGSELRLRLVNGWVWVNDLDDGGTWVTNDLLPIQALNDWSRAVPTQIEDSILEDDGGDAPDSPDTVIIDDPNALGAVENSDDYNPNEENVQPIAVDDASRTRVDRAVVIDVLANDTDLNNDILIVSNVELTAGDARVTATASLQEVQVTPGAGFLGVIQFTYWVSDGRSEPVAAAVVVDVLSNELGNRPPDPVTDVVATAPGNATTIDVLRNDSDPDGDALALTLITTETGTLRWDPSGQVTFTPDTTTAAGWIELPYIVSDDLGASAPGVLRVEIRDRGANQEPDARNDQATTVASRPVAIDLLENDSDPDGDPLLVSSRPRLLTSPKLANSPMEAEARTSTTPDGEFIFEADEPGVYLFEYSINDGAEGGSESDTARIRVDVAASIQNASPIAVRDDVVLAIGDTRTVYVLDNDGDPDGDVISIVDWSASPGLLIAEFNDGTGHVGFQITASPTARRPTFTYAISDGVNLPVTAAVVVSLVGQGTLDQPPFALDDLVEVRAGSTVQRAEVLANDFDPEGGSLRIVSTGDIADARVNIAADAQSLSIAVPSGAFTSFTVPYDIEDEGGNRAAAVLRVQLIARDAPNRPPTARADQARTREGQAIRIDVLRNDSDPDADAIALEGVADQPEHGSASVTTDGVIQYTPDPDFTGTDIFQYAIVDAIGDRALGEVFVGVVDQLGVNLPPIANDDSYVLAGTPATTPLEVRANDFDPEGDPLRVVEVTPANVGSVAIDLFGRVEYIPPARLAEATVVTFDYVIADTAGNRARASVTIELDAFEERIQPTPPPITEPEPTPEPTPTPDPLNIEPTPTPVPTPTPETDLENEPPVAVNDDRGPVLIGSNVRVSVLDNDFDPDGSVEALKIIAVESGAVIDGSEIVIDNIRDTVQVSYTIADRFGAEASALVTVVVIANQAPVVAPLAIETAFETAISVDVSAQASDIDGDTLFFICCDDRRNGEVTEVATAANQLSLLFTPASGFVGQAAFSYQVDDQQGHQSAGIVTVTVLAPNNRAPIVVSNTVQVPQGTTVTVDLSQLSSDPDGDLLTRSLLTAPSNGVDVTVQGETAQVIVDRNTSVGAAGVFTYLVSDGVLDTQGSVAIEIIEGANEAPLVVDSEIEVAAASSATVDLAALTNETDPGDSVVWTLDDSSFDPLTVVLNGSLVQIAAPATAVNTEHTIAFTATDTRSATGSGIVTVSVVGPTEPEPVAVADEAIASRGERVTIDVLGNDVDPLALGLTVSLVEASWGTATVVNNQVQFSPGNRVGVATVSYTILDVAERDSTGTITIEVVGVPDQPAPPSVVPDSGQVTIAWTNPAPNGRPVTGYLITIDTGEVREVGVQNSYVWSSLTNGQSYTFSVAAINEIGTSEASEFSLSAVPNQVPEQPAPPTAEFDDRQLTIRWTAPANAGTEITGYEIEIGPVSAIEQIGTDTTFVWQGLTNGQDYTFRVRAKNDAGFSPFSALSAPEHPSDEPEAPTIGATDRGTLGGSLIAHWSKPVDNGDEIIEYEILSSEGGTNRVTGADTVSFVWSDLTNGNTISFQVRARNRAGWSDLSDPSEGVPPCGVPSPPTNVNAVRGDGRVEITWDEAVDNGCQVTGYTIATSAGAIQNSAVASHTFTGLVNGDPYSFNIRATNERGVSTASSPSDTVIPAGPPLCAVGSWLAATITAEESVDLAWLPAIDNGAPIIEYLVDTGTTPLSTTDNVMVVGNLTDGTPYSFSLTARNEVGTSAPCGTANAITWRVPTNIQLTLTFDIDTKYLTASVLGGQSLDEATRLGYTWELSGPSRNDSNGEYPFPTGQVHAKSIDWEITEDGDYDVTIVGCNAAGCKNAEASIEILLAAPPDQMQPSDIILSEAAKIVGDDGPGTAMRADLRAPANNGADIIEYDWQARQYFGPGPRFGRGIGNGTEPIQSTESTFFRFDHLAGHSDYYAGVNDGLLVTWRLRVRAVNEEGSAEEWSEWVEWTPPNPTATVSGRITGRCGSDSSCARMNLGSYGLTPNDSYGNITAEGGGRSADCDSVSTGPAGDIAAGGFECNFDNSTPYPASFTLTIDGVTANIS